MEKHVIAPPVYRHNELRLAVLFIVSAELALCHFIACNGYKSHMGIHRSLVTIE